MADISLSIKGLEKHIPLILEALNYYSGYSLELLAYKPMGQPSDSRFEFMFPEKGNNNNKEFAENVIIELLTAVIKMYKLKKNTETYNNTISNVSLPVHNISDEIFIKGDV